MINSRKIEIEESRPRKWSKKINGANLRRTAKKNKDNGKIRRSALLKKTVHY